MQSIYGLSSIIRISLDKIIKKCLVNGMENIDKNVSLSNFVDSYMTVTYFSRLYHMLSLSTFYLFLYITPSNHKK